MSNNMNLEARAYPFEEPKGNQLAFASVDINDSFAITGIRVMNGENGPFVAMPSTRDKDGNFRDICFPTNKELRAELNTTVLNAYTVALEKQKEKAPVKESEKPSAIDKIKDAEKKAKNQPAKEKPEKAKSDVAI